MRRVVVFLAYPHVFGGGESQAQLLAQHLPACGWQASFLLPANGTLRERLGDLRTEVVPAPRALMTYGGNHDGPGAARAAIALPRYWIKLARHFREHADVVQSITQRGALLAGPAARLAGRPFVWHVGGIEPSRVFNRFGSFIADRSVAMSHAIAREAPGLGGRLSVVPNAVNPMFFEAGTGVRRVPPVIICSARLTPEKGVDVLIRASVPILRRFPDTQVVVIGEVQRGHEQHAATLERMIADLGVGRGVHLAGFAEHPSEMLATASVYVQPSRSEGFGIAAAEAMAVGLPVVASRVGGLGEVIDDGTTGVLVPAEDPDALTREVIRLLEDPVRAVAMGAAGRQRARERFSATRLARDFTSVYEGLVS